MKPEEIKKNISNAISAFSSGNLTNNSMHLFQTLGYNTERSAHLVKTDFNNFKESYLTHNSNFNEDKALVSEWKYVDLLFQLSKTEILKQTTLFDTKKVDNTLIETYLFFTIELNSDHYTRGNLSSITREVNKVFPMPVMILFKHNSFLTLSVINRRLHKRDESKDVLEKVTLIKDIQIPTPSPFEGEGRGEVTHRAHIEILFDLSFEQLKSKHNFTNFVELHEAWQKTLDIKELNKKFYEKLFNWYLWALKQVEFPQIRPKDDMMGNEIHQSESLIRLLTRLLFVWFMKEKGLINPVLFDRDKLQSILKKFVGVNSEETIYYKAILQNLFFATLNKPILDRKIIDKGFNPKEYGDPLVYRYDELFNDPNNFIKLFENIPFLNGGLFECLDQKKDLDNPAEIRLDGFSTKKNKQPIVPDKLFFGEYKNVDLSKDYDDKKKSKQTVFGLIDILNQYKFTIEENTPVEEEVALDPELLGKVFENLLASYNPETKTTARKQTGSFYTPREIVTYMVDESIIAYLKNQVDDEERLRKLLSYSKSEIENPFDEKETLILLKAIDTCKILDPACGSGAFPMGILQKMIFILHKLDPTNKLWFDMVVENIPAYMRDEFRKRLSKETWNYVRKLGIIQQCIYGIDIQPIATQIAKLRFFISLLVDQVDKPEEPNRGFEPLPNLDFKIVTANTLISAPASDVKSEGLFEEQADPFFEEFDNLTEQYFTASIEEDKKKLKKNITALINKKCEDKIEQIERSYAAEDERVKKALKEKKKEFIAAKENEIKLWKSYTNIFKHESVGFFEPRYFFPKVKDGFDIVIGNPPYVEAKKLKEVSQTLRKHYQTYSGTADLYVYFYENGIRNLKPNGTLVFITSNKFVKTSYGENLRKYFIKYKINEIIDFTDVHVFEALVASCIVSISKKQLSESKIKIAFANDSLADFADVTNFIEQNKFFLEQNNLSGKIWQLEHETKLSLKSKIESGSVTILKTESINVYRGVTTGYNPAFIIDDEKRNELLREDKASKSIIKPLLQGRNIRKWLYTYSDKFLLQTGYDLQIKKDYPSIFKHLNSFKKELEIRADQGIAWWNLRACKYYSEFEREKIIWGLTSDKWTFAYDNSGNYLPSNGYILTSNEIPIKYLLALMNSRVMEFYFSFIGIMTAGGAFTLKYETVVEFPIKIVPESQQKPFIEIVNKILSKKASNSDADISNLEQQIDEMVYKLYNLTYEEVRIIDPAFALTEKEYDNFKIE